MQKVLFFSTYKTDTKFKGLADMIEAGIIDFKNKNPKMIVSKFDIGPGKVGEDGRGSVLVTVTYSEANILVDSEDCKSHIEQVDKSKTKAKIDVK